MIATLFLSFGNTSKLNLNSHSYPHFCVLNKAGFHSDHQLQSKRLICIFVFDTLLWLLYHRRPEASCSSFLQFDSIHFRPSKMIIVLIDGLYVGVLFRNMLIFEKFSKSYLKCFIWLCNQNSEKPALMLGTATLLKLSVITF